MIVFELHVARQNVVTPKIPSSDCDHFHADDLTNSGEFRSLKDNESRHGASRLLAPTTQLTEQRWPPVLRAATEYAKGQALAGSVDEAIDNLEQACELAERVPEAATARAEALGMLGRAHLVSGRAERAAECARAAADLASADPVITADAQAVHGVKRVCAQLSVIAVS